MINPLGAFEISATLIKVVVILKCTHHIYIQKLFSNANSFCPKAPLTTATGKSSVARRQ